MWHADSELYVDKRTLPKLHRLPTNLDAFSYSFYPARLSEELTFSDIKKDLNLDQPVQANEYFDITRP